MSIIIRSLSVAFAFTSLIACVHHPMKGQERAPSSSASSTFYTGTGTFFNDGVKRVCKVQFISPSNGDSGERLIQVTGMDVEKYGWGFSSAFVQSSNGEIRVWDEFCHNQMEFEGKKNGNTVELNCTKNNVSIRAVYTFGENGSLVGYEFYRNGAGGSCADFTSSYPGLN